MASPNVTLALPAYRGLYTSLYDSLSAEAVKDVERAIWFKMTGRPDKGRAIFDNDLMAFGNFPVVVIERADLEFETGRWGAAWRILDSKLRELKEANADLDLPEHRLMALTSAMLGARHRGDLASAACEIERTQHWLRDVPVADYTDIQASCIRRYVIAYLFAMLSSNYQNPSIELIPIDTVEEGSSEQKIPWAGLGQLRRCLTTRGMFYEANAVFRVELNRTPLGDRERVVEEFLSAVVEIPTSHGREFIEASVRLQWGTTYVLLQALPRAVEEMARSEAAFKMYCDEFGITNRAITPHLQALTYERLSLLQDPIDKLEKAQQLAIDLEEVQSAKTGMCLSTAADLAKSLYQYTAETGYLDTFFSVQERLEKYDETESEDLCDLVLHRNYLSSLTLNHLVDRQKSLEWIQGFFQKYDYFTSPAELSSLFRRQALLLRGLRKMDEGKLADEKADVLDASRPLPGKWLHMGALNRNLPVANGGDDSPGYDSEDEGADLPFYASWEVVLGDFDKTKETAVKLILDWSLEDIITGHLAIEDFRKMVNDPELQITSVEGAERAADIERLRGSEAGKIASFIFTTDASPETPQEESYNCICDWLTRFPKGQRDKRLFCLLTVREARQLHFSDMHFWDLRVRELNHLLELYPKLPRQILEFSSFSKGSWLAALTLTYTAQLDYISDFRDQKTIELLSTAERYNDAALEELRQRYHPVQVAIQQRTGARICMLHILRLKQLSQTDSPGAGIESGEQKTDIDNSTDAHVSVAPVDTFADINTIRTIGLDKIKESDKIYTESELHASWNDGLHGINDRQSISAFHASSFTIYTAINLLLAEPGGASKDTIAEIWKWVQKYKARSLARTIGIHASDPPGLVSQIMASEKARPVYEEMLRLDRQIKEAKPSERFYLRRQRDAHQNIMKEIGLLRQLTDLREGTPFDNSDIAAINAQVGAPIVLIDWFYLPPFLVGETGRLLLFTAKADSHPTMDTLTTTMEDIQTWQKTYLTPEKWKEDREEMLRGQDARTAFDKMLGGLVAPLADRTKADEILVLCPSTTLHRLPLHALSITTSDPTDSSQFGLEGLIHRNPVVYIHSHSLLRSSFSATEHARYSPISMNPQFLSGILASEALYYDKKTHRQFDFTAGRESIERLAEWFNTKPMMDKTASKEDFIGVVTKSRLLHLHTHCNWDFSDPLDHHVELPSPNGASEPGLRQVTKLTTREVFDIRVLPGTHVNVIACQGGVIEVKPGDEVMGLIPALLYSGASSTVSTLWSIGDVDGADFAFHFFDSFLQQCVNQGNGREGSGEQKEGDRLPNMPERGLGCIVDIARAVRTAVTKMDSGQNKPLYHWAGYILHGFWQYPLSKEDTEWLQQEHGYMS
ncbi:hypothetical protein VE00_02777 [Pseudogymnoascus sp. WSF 3629]|nr:hypothetical protein VE00_02777 [Pseudogymnoascus sp. WSF 3629]